MTTIQLDTVSPRKDPRDYWDDVATYEETFENYFGDEETALMMNGTIQTAIESADYERFVVDTKPENIHDNPNADVLVRAYDGYNE